MNELRVIEIKYKPDLNVRQARVAQLVEHNLAKVGVASSNLVSRSNKKSARMVELVDTPDLKSCACMGVRVQVPLRVLKPHKEIYEAFFVLYFP